MAYDGQDALIHLVLANFDAKTTIRRNLRHFDTKRRQLVVERAFFHARKHRQFEWQVVVCLDQSDSMAASLGFQLSREQRAGVIANLERTATIAAPMLAFALADEAEPAPVFTA